MPLWLLGVGLLPVKAQTWKLDPKTPVKVEIAGTSSLHDWTVTTSGVQKVPSKLVLGPEQLDEIKEFGFKVPVDSMEGGRGSSMDNKIFDAFKSSTNPFVEYQQVTPASISKAADGKYTITSQGKLSMAGKEKSITVVCTGTVADNALLISGNHKIKMSEFDMVPPSAMFGQIKTHDDVVVNFELRYILDK